METKREVINKKATGKHYKALKKIIENLNTIDENDPDTFFTSVTAEKMGKIVKRIDKLINKIERDKRNCKG